MNVRADLVRELKTLRKGRGVCAGRIGERVGPALRAACEVTDSDGPVVVRQKVLARLVVWVNELPENLHLPTLAAFAVNAEARLPLYQDRVDWVAARTNRESRTVRRRVDEAINQLAELATHAVAGSVGSSADGWHTTELSVAVALDQPRPELLEQRRIVANQDELCELDLAVSVPAVLPDLEVDVLYGGTLVNRAMESSDRLGFTLTLAKSISRGDSHDFAVRFRFPDISAMNPYVVCVPRRPCELFDLRVRFRRDRTLPRVWMLRGAFQRDVADPLYHGHHHPIDPAGEVHMRFRQLTPGLAFGARWEVDSAAER